MNTATITLKIEVVLSKTLFVLIIEKIDIANPIPKTGIKYRFLPKSSPPIETSFSR